MRAENPAALWAETLRREAEALLRPLAPGAFLRWARGAGLLVTDARARGLTTTEALKEAFLPMGWRVEPEASRGLTRLSPGPERLARLEAGGVAGGFSRTLERFRGLPPEGAEEECLLEGLKLSALPEDAGALSAWEKRVRQRAALALRQGGGGGLFACGTLLEALWARSNEKGI